MPGSQSTLRSWVWQRSLGKRDLQLFWEKKNANCDWYDIRIFSSNKKRFISCLFFFFSFFYSSCSFLCHLPPSSSSSSSCGKEIREAKDKKKWQRSKEDSLLSKKKTVFHASWYLSFSLSLSHSLFYEVMRAEKRKRFLLCRKLLQLLLCFMNKKTDLCLHLCILENERKRLRSKNSVKEEEMDG